ncbi:MAG: carboxypeptidase regulatory-like domain-containing protein [Armatimonadota bacterium]
MHAVVLLTALLLLGLFSGTGWAQASWHIYLDGADITGPAAPITRGESATVNVVALETALGFTTSLSSDTLTIIDANGTEWHARSGDGTLESGGRTLTLDSPLLIMAPAAYLPLSAVAEVAGLQLKLDHEKRRAELTTSKQQPSEQPAEQPSELADGWESISIEKTPEELKTSASAQSTSINKTTIKPILPPSHDSLKLGLGFGYVPGGDCTTELTASGGIGGVYLDFGTSITLGPKGVLPSNLRLSLVDKEFGWEAGDLYSELGGGERGARYSWQIGSNRRPSLSLYLKNDRTSSHGLMLSYKDEIILNSKLSVGGEIASNGSSLFKAKYNVKRFNLSGFARYTAPSASTTASTGSGSGSGVFASYDLGKGISLYGSLNRSGKGVDRQEGTSLSLRLPIARGVDLTMEHTTAASSLGNSSADAAMLSLPLGPVRLLIRQQWRNSARPVSGPTLDWIGNDSSDLTASASYYVNPRLSFDYQVSNRWQDGIYSGRYENLVSSWRISSRTQLQVISAFPHIMEPSQLRLRLNHDMPQNFSVSAEYGNQSADGSGTDKMGLKFMFRKRWVWGIPTPVRGGEVRGRVLDLANQPISNAVVKLGAYRAVADEKGQYLFRNVPTGVYVLSLDNENLAADYKGDETTRSLKITSASRQKIDLVVAPLNTISGRVFCDTNENGTCDPGEGVANIVIHIADFATVTGRDGSFSFYNLEPGNHSVKLDTDRLLAGYAPASPVEMSVVLLPDKQVSGVTFTLVVREKEIDFQEVP